MTALQVVIGCRHLVLLFYRARGLDCHGSILLPNCRYFTETLFLASAAPTYVYGAIIPVDGGWLGR